MEVDNKFKVGDTVVLMSGGPVMTISNFVSNMFTKEINHNRVNCKWFEGSNLKSAEFDTSSLKRSI